MAYDKDFFSPFRDLAFSSARTVVPILKDLVLFRSVVDVGCGTGVWLAVFKEMGCDDIQGLDGDYIDPSILEIPRDNFRPTDLTKGFPLDRRFDLAVTLEVAEHIPPQYAALFLDHLTRLADVVLFSAAVPDQGGQSHVNEQWQDWWAERFAERGYVAIDAIRPRVWRNPKVSCEYAQNMLLYVARARLPDFPKLEAELASTRPEQLSIIHPRFFTTKVGEAGHVSGRKAVASIWEAAVRKVRRPARR